MWKDVRAHSFSFHMTRPTRLIRLVRSGLASRNYIHPMSSFLLFSRTQPSRGFENHPAGVAADLSRLSVTVDLGLSRWGGKEGDDEEMANKEEEKKKAENEGGGRLSRREPCWWHGKSDMHTVTRRRQADIQVGWWTHPEQRSPTSTWRERMMPRVGGRNLGYSYHRGMWADYIPAHRDSPPVHSFPGTSSDSSDPAPRWLLSSGCLVAKSLFAARP